MSKTLVKEWASYGREKRRRRLFIVCEAHTKQSAAESVTLFKGFLFIELRADDDGKSCIRLSNGIGLSGRSVERRFPKRYDRHFRKLRRQSPCQAGLKIFQREERTREASLYLRFIEEQTRRQRSGGFSGTGFWNGLVVMRSELNKLKTAEAPLASAVCCL